MKQTEFLDVEVFIPALRRFDKISDSKRLIAFKQSAVTWVARFRGDNITLVLTGETPKSLEWMRAGGT